MRVDEQIDEQTEREETAQLLTILAASLRRGASEVVSVEQAERLSSVTYTIRITEHDR